MERKYPYYGKFQFGELIVYFTSLTNGFVIKNDEDYYIGVFRKDWFSANFVKIIDKQEIKELDKKRKIIQLSK